VVAGFSGALTPGQSAGTLILATRILDEHGSDWPASWPGDRPTAIQRGRILTADRLVTEPADKAELGARYQAIAVDMESAAAARLCCERGVPFGCLRAISDTVDTRLSLELVDLLKAGRPSILAVLAALCRKPLLAGELWTLAQNTRIAAKNLAAALGELVTMEALANTEPNAPSS
jgi:adenosylhomocysteine nucleosidase